MFGTLEFGLKQTADLKVVVKENQLMEAAIMRVDKARFELKLSLRKSDTMPNPDKARKEKERNHPDS